MENTLDVQWRGFPPRGRAEEMEESWVGESGVIKIGRDEEEFAVVMNFRKGTE